MSSIRSHNNYFKLLRGTQVLVGYLTSTLTRDEFHPAHTYTTTFWLYIYIYIYIYIFKYLFIYINVYQCMHTCSRIGHKHACMPACSYVCLQAVVAGGCSFSPCQCNVYVSRESCINFLRVETRSCGCICVLMYVCMYVCTTVGMLCC